MSIYRIHWAAWAVILSAVGCQPADEIRSYIVPKEAAAAAMPAVAAEPTDRMITAILPDGDRAWFLKVVGPLAEIDGQAEEINSFFETVRVAPNKPHPGWQLPEGWKQDGESAMRAATIWIPTDNEPLEMSVIALPWSADEATLLSNVNRWRGQMQLPPIGLVALAECTSELKAGDATMTVVDLRGRLGSTGMTPPFAQRAQRAGSSPSPIGESAAADGGLLPPGHPPITAGAPAGGASLTFDAPESWESLPATGIRKAAFRIVDEADEALVTAMDFPASAGPMIADPLANVNRWRGEVGLPPISEERLADVTDSIEVDGKSATFVDAVPDASKPEQSQADRGTLAAMVADGQRIWFFKLFGDRDLVAAERDNFRSFLKSVRFTPDGGAGNGD